MKSAEVSTPPGTRLALEFDRSFRRSLSSPVFANSEHFWLRLRFSPLRLKTVAVFGSIDCALRSLRLQTIFDGYTLANTDTSVCAYGVASLPFRCQPETSTCFSEPSMPVCFAPFSISHGLHTQAAFLPPIEEAADFIPNPRH